MLTQPFIELQPLPSGNELQKEWKDQLNEQFIEPP